MSSTLTRPQIPTLTVEQIGPDQARQYLSNMAPNRKPSAYRVENLAQLMLHDQWIFDGAPIRFDIEGRLLDGQNRLGAIIRSGMTLPFTVVKNLASESMMVMDTGKTRTFQDILTMHHPDITDSSAVASTARLLYLWENGARGSDLERRGQKGPIPTVVLEEFFANNKNAILNASKYARGLTRRGLLGFGSAALGVAYHLFASIDQDDADWFFEHLVSGEDLTGNHPILALRRRGVEAVMAGRRTRKAALPNDEALALLIKAWNAFRDGSKMQTLVFRRGGSAPERFPEPR